MNRFLPAAAVAAAALFTAAPALAGGTPAPSATAEAAPQAPAGAVPIVDPKMPVKLASIRVTGTIRMTDCNAGAGDVHVAIDGRTVTVTPDDQGLTFRYDSGPIAPGHHMVVPTMAAGVCRGGAWTPGNAGIDVTAGSTANTDFNFGMGRLTRTISAGVLRVLGSTIFGGLSVHLNNHDPIAAPWRDDFYNPGSFISYGPTMDHVAIDIPATTMQWGTGPAHFYVNGVTAGNGIVGLDGSELKVSLFMHGNGGPEILGYQRASVVSPPDIRMQNGRLDLFLLPARDIAGRITYTKTRATFNADISGTGVIGWVADTFMPSYRTQIKAGIETQMQAFLDRADTRERIASLLQAQMRAIGIGNVTAVRSTGTDLVVEYIPTT